MYNVTRGLVNSTVSVEKYLILYPATFILDPGLIYMVLMPLGDAVTVFSNGSGTIGDRPRLIKKKLKGS